MRNVIFRTDASNEIGIGHLSRCLTLAKGLTENVNGVEVFFLLSDISKEARNLIHGQGFKYKVLENIDNRCKYESDYEYIEANYENDAKSTIEIIKNLTPDWLILDHYSLDYRWEQLIRPYTKNILVIDDLANRHHECDMLLDQNLFHNMDTRYSELLPNKCVKLLGPRYALLREEFRIMRKKVSREEGRIKRVLVSFGGSDPSNEVSKVLKAITGLELCRDIEVDVILGQYNQKAKNFIDEYKTTTNIKFYHHTNNIAEFMINADLAIGGGGVTSWERCCLGLPSIIISIAKNQEEISKVIHNKKLGIYLGNKEEVNTDHIKKQLLINLKNKQLNKTISENAMSLVDGEGVHRVVNTMIE